MDTTLQFMIFLTLAIFILAIVVLLALGSKINKDAKAKQDEEDRKNSLPFGLDGINERLDRATSGKRTTYRTKDISEFVPKYDETKERKKGK